MKKILFNTIAWLFLFFGLIGGQGEISASVFDDVEPNNTYNQAQPIELGKKVTGFLTFSDYVDIYTFELTNPTSVKFELESEVESILWQIGDGDSKILLDDVFNREGNQLINEVFEYYLEPGKYFVRVVHNRALAPAGSYWVKVSTPLFSDLGEGWWTSHVKEFVDLGFVNGYGDGTFKPQNSITRAEFVKIVNKAFGLAEKYEPVTDLPFMDLDSQWKKDELKLALAAGYVTPAAEFRHNAPINRQEAAKIIGYLLGDTLINDSDWKFADSHEIATWAQDYVAGLVEAGVLSKNESFRPKDPITRAEAVKMLNIARGL